MEYNICSFSNGNLFLAGDRKGICMVQYLRLGQGFEKQIRFFENLGIAMKPEGSKFTDLLKQFDRYFNGKKVDFKEIKLDFLLGTSYQRRVWEKARQIDYGKTVSYKSIALQLNHHGYRSIGQALNRNPLLILIPCHRVISSDGSLGGFGAGTELKRYLLQLENIHYNAD
jgi:methylated-DNA-[protein]-cysteine S-methyltransferase